MPFNISNQFLKSFSLLYTTASFFLFLSLCFSIKRGLQGRPASVNIRNSFAVILKEIDIKILINPLRRYAFNNLVMNSGSPVIPNRVPLTNTFVMFLLLYTLQFINGITPISCKHSLIFATSTPAVILARIARFLR